MTRQRVAWPPGAELGLKFLAHLIGPVVRRGVRIAVLQNVKRSGFRGMRELLEERHQSSRAFQNADRLGGSFANRPQGCTANHGRNVNHRYACAFFVGLLFRNSRRGRERHQSRKNED